MLWMENNLTSVQNSALDYYSFIIFHAVLKVLDVFYSYMEIYQPQIQPPFKVNHQAFIIYQKPFVKFVYAVVEGGGQTLHFTYAAG